MQKVGMEFVESFGKVVVIFHFSAKTYSVSTKNFVFYQLSHTPGSPTTIFL